MQTGRFKRRDGPDDRRRRFATPATRHLRLIESAVARRTLVLLLGFVCASQLAVAQDCNDNGIRDEQDIVDGTSEDCNGNGNPDECEIDENSTAPGGPFFCDPNESVCDPDCNNNGIPDTCDVPQTCEPLVTCPVASTWVGEGGLWDDPPDNINWCLPEAPNNNANATFVVTIDVPTALVVLNTSPTVSTLSLLNEAVVLVDDQSGANVRTLAVDGSITNSGIFRATDRERFVLDGGVINQGNCGEGGTLEAIDGNRGFGEDGDKSILEISGSEVIGGTVHAVGTHSEIQLTNGAVLTDTCVDGLVVVPDGERCRFTETIVNNGLVTIRGTIFNALLEPAGSNAVLDSNNSQGVVRLTSENHARLGSFFTSFTNADAHRIEGAGILFGGITNNGVIDANDEVGGHLIIFPPGAKINSGDLSATGNGTLRIEDTVTQTARGIIRVAEGGTVEVNANISGVGGLIAQGGTIRISNSSFAASNFEQFIGAQLDVVNGMLSVNGSFTFTNTDPDDWLWDVDSVLAMTGGVGLPDDDPTDHPQLEVGGTDFGEDKSGFSNNFDLSKLVIGPGAHVKLADEINNAHRGPGGNAEALYVDTLEFADAAGRLSLSGIHLYYKVILCHVDAHCNDLDKCTDDLCDLATNTCSNPPITGCCASDADCPGKCDYCDLATNTCQKLSPDVCCDSDDHCIPLFGPKCAVCDLADNTCLKVPGCCDRDEQCTGKCDFCDLATNTCENLPPDVCCDSDDQCGKCETCDLVTNTCNKDVPDCCTSDADCSGKCDDFCDLGTNTCASDIPDGERSEQFTSYTQVESPCPEAGHREILSGIYGANFVGSGTHLGNGLFTVFSNGTVTAERIDDFGIGTVLNLVSGRPGNGDDSLWQDGIAVAAAEARYSAFPQEFGYHAGSGFVKLFEITGSQFAVSARGMVNFGMDTIWAWARANGSDGTLVNDHYSLETMNGDGLDHMITYRITGIADVPDGQTVWLLFWEELNGPLGDNTDPENQAIRSDRDFNDLVIEVTAFECIEPFDCTDPDRLLCDTSRGVCVECLEDADCDGGVCNGFNCEFFAPDPRACCLPDTSCAIMDLLVCLDEGGTPKGPGSVCGGVEACCLPDQTCEEMDTQCCLMKGGKPQGAGTNCGECAAGPDCGIRNAGDCMTNTFPNAGDPVEVHMNALGILLDGAIGDAEAAGAVCLVDTVPDEAGNIPGPAGDNESPRIRGGNPDPNGFNIRCSMLLFVPDSNPVDGADDSFLYIAWDISDNLDADGLRPRQYDSDDNDSASVFDPASGVGSDLLPELYQVLVQACTNPDVFDPALGDEILAERIPKSILTDFDANLLMFNLDAAPLSISSDPAGLDAFAFPTADGATNLSNICIDLEVDSCAAGNNVELVIKRVETNGAFGPNATATPDSEEARQNRFALAELLANLHAASDGDLSDEEIANTARRTSIPDIEVTKKVGCADAGTAFSTHVEALLGSDIEYEFTITNVGNEDLDITVTDVMQAIGTQAGFATCGPICETLEAFLTSPRRGLIDEPVHTGNAIGLGLEQAFFVDLCATPDLGLLGNIRNGESEFLGTLLGALVTRDAGTCGFADGDMLVIRFRGRMDPSDQDRFCSAFDVPDCQNSVTVTATLAGESEIVATDEADSVDTDRELQSGFDDNVVTSDILCREIELVKEVRLLPNADPDAGWHSGKDALGIPANISFPALIEYRYTVTNNGEVDEDVTVDDVGLCDDLAIPADGVAFVPNECPLCETGDSSKDSGIAAANGGTFESKCQVQFDSQNDLQTFLSVDDIVDANSDCDANPAPGEDTPFCYRNCASATGSATNLGSTCPDGPIDSNDSSAEFCSRPCVLEVTKQVRCLPNCNATDPGPWVDDPAELEVTPGACVQYRIIVTNDSSGNVPVCALKFNDQMTNKGNFASGPDNVQVSGSTTCANLFGEFNWDGVDVICELDPPLLPTESITMLFQAVVAASGVADPAVDSENRIEVRGAAEGDCPTGAPPNFSDDPCDDDPCCQEDSVTVDVQSCEFDVTKEVKCVDDPDSAYADHIEAMPGTTSVFRIQVCNTGDVNIPRVGITDVLSCGTWFVADSVVAMIDGNSVTSCICTDADNSCDQIGDINGLKDLTPCRAGGILPGECLTITFEVKVPAGFAAIGTDVDCTNTVTVEGFTDVCSSPTVNPCGEDTDSATIDVKVPRVDCDKCVCADLDNDGTCDTPCVSRLSIEDCPEEFQLQYRFTVRNNGETDLTDAEICDARFFEDAGALLVGCNRPVDLDPVSPDFGCIQIGFVGQGSSESARCTIAFPDPDAWANFANIISDVQTCYLNTSDASATPDPGPDVCDDPPPSPLTSSCSAEVCCGGAAGGVISEWVGGHECALGGGHECWSIPENWDPQVVPDNQAGGSEFDVTISVPGSRVTLDINPDLSSLSLKADTVLEVNASSANDPSTRFLDSPIDNGGSIRAVDGFELLLNKAIIQTESGVIEACDEGSAIQINQARVAGGTIRSANGGQLFLLRNAILVDVTVDGATISNSTVIDVRIDNVGVITLEGTLLARGDAVLDGGGRVDMKSAQSVLGDFNGHLTNAAAHHIGGTGIVFGEVTNNGTIEANDVNGEHLFIFPPFDKINSGTLRAVRTGVLAIRTTIDQTDTGTIEARDCGVVKLNADVTGTGSFRVYSRDVTAQGGCTPPPKLVLADRVSVTGSTLEISDECIVEVAGSAAFNLTGDVTIDSGGTYQGLPSSAASLSAENVSILCSQVGNTMRISGGEMRLSDSMELLVRQNLVLGTAELAQLGSVVARRGGCTPPPKLSVLRSARVDVDGSLWLLDSEVTIEVDAGTTFALAGDFDNRSVSPASFDWLGAELLLNGSEAQVFELAGRDAGPTLTGFCDNFAIRQVEIDTGSNVTFANIHENTAGLGPCVEALYVHDLILRAGSAVTLDNCRIYYETFIDEGANLALVGDCSGFVQLPPVADFNQDGSINLEDWMALAPPKNDPNGGCLKGPGNQYATGCEVFDFDHDCNVDLADVASFQIEFTEP